VAAVPITSVRAPVDAGSGTMPNAGLRWPPPTSVRALPARPTLAASALWLLASNLAYAACQWGAIAGLAKLGAPTAVGRLGLALAVATPVVQITGFGLRAVQATDVVRRYAFCEYLHLRLAANVLAAAVIAAAARLGALDGDALAILVPIGVAKIVEATSETCYGLAQRHDRMRFVALSRVARGAVGLVGLIAIVARGGTLAAGAWALAAAWSAFLLLVDLPVAATLESPFARPRLRAVGRLARESAPLGGVQGLYAVSQNVPRYLLAASQGAAAVGYFTALAAINPPLSQVATAVCHAAAPRLGAAAADARRYRRLVLRLAGLATAFGAVLVAGVVVAGRPFLALAYAEDYAARHVAFVVVAAGAALGLVNEVFYFALLALRRTRLQLGLECAAVAVTAAVGAALVPRFGLTGAALALVAAASARLLVGAGVVLGGAR